MVQPYAGYVLLCPLALISSLACGPASTPSEVSRAEALKSAAASTASSVPSLGTAGSFALLAGTAVTCTDSTVAGNVGVSPGAALAQTNCPVVGTIHSGDTVAAQARNDFFVAYDQFKALPCDRALTTLDGQTLTPGVYCFDAAATSTGGVLTLDGPANGLWIFKIGTLGTGALTGTNFSVVTRAGTPLPCGNVFWWVADAVTMTDSKLVGTILAGGATTLTRGTFNGDAFAKAAVTVTGNAVTSCALGGPAGPPPPPVCTNADEKNCKCKDVGKKHGDTKDKHGSMQRNKSGDHDDECDDDNHDGDHRDGGDHHEHD